VILEAIVAINILLFGHGLSVVVAVVVSVHLLSDGALDEDTYCYALIVLAALVPNYRQ
jgi:hypothetical protein